MRFSRTSLRLSFVTLIGLSVAVVACRADHTAQAAPPPADTVAQLDTQTAHVAEPVPAKPELSPLADSIAEKIVFPPRGQLWFTAAARGKRMLVDLGRVDMDVKQEPRLSAFREAVERLSPVALGSRFRLTGPWGVDSATLASFDVWNGRVVGVLTTSEHVDSLAKKVEPLPAAAALTDSAILVAADSCRRDSIRPELAERAQIVRDSMEQDILNAQKPPYQRLQNSLKVSSSRIAGCYGKLGRLLLIVSARAGNTEWVAERMAIVDDTGYATAVKSSDYRFRAHDGVYAFDADRDGVDDLAARALGEAMGGLTIMRLDTARKRLDRLTAGFSWEAR
ncbi:MAG: hypothetical protein HOQ12_13990 [Gemmatimonadaceae bacterium]|nr:hypothetical protein [Gemmatimonadaceae bacterium]NUQ91580.1 hypothetical protein [Gemmatimonadaceae bacterium]NUR20642.1 hypothetical protein [Gemmatimonadaceae bacterium]